MPRLQHKRQWDLLVGSLPSLHAYVRRVVGNHEAARDVLQEVSLRVLAGGGPAEPARFRAWTRGIARHVISHDWRVRRAHAEVPLEGAATDEVHDPQADPEGRFEARRALARVLRRIDSDGLELLVRRYVLQETGRELAHAMDQTPAAMRMRLMRLRSTLAGRARASGPAGPGPGPVS